MFEFITKAVVAISLAIGSLFTPQADTPVVPEQDPSIEHDRVANRIEQLESLIENLGAYNPSGGGTYRLKTSIGTTNTTITLSSFKEPVSEVPYTMTYLNTSVAYGTLDPQNTTRSEFISFTGITQNADGSATLTGVTRGLSRSYPFTASSTLRQAHSGQSIFILSDSPQHFSEYAVKQNNETITGQWTFSTFPITASTSFASETVGGIVELATNTEAASTTASGTVARLALPASMATSACQVAGHYVPITDSATGRLDRDCIDTSALPQVTMVAGETINGATLPVPVYASSGPNQVFASDANATGTMRFIGFAISDGTASSSITVQTSGLVSGFTGLDVGATYYVQDTVGTIGTTKGSTAIVVGIAVTSTTVMIQKPKLTYSDVLTVGTSNATSTITLGWKPSRVRLDIMSNTGVYLAHSVCVWDNGAMDGIFGYGAATANTTKLDGSCINRVDGSSNQMTFSITDSDTGFTIVMVEGSTYPGGVLLWTAESEI